MQEFQLLVPPFGNEALSEVKKTALFLYVNAGKSGIMAATMKCCLLISNLENRLSPVQCPALF